MIMSNCESYTAILAEYKIKIMELEMSKKVPDKQSASQFFFV